jgi:hypothetical protein
VELLGVGSLTFVVKEKRKEYTFKTTSFRGRALLTLPLAWICLWPYLLL